MSEENNKPKFHISRRRTIKGVNGMTLQEDVLCVEGDNLKSITKEFDKRWKENV